MKSQKYRAFKQLRQYQFKLTAKNQINKDFKASNGYVKFFVKDNRYDIVWNQVYKQRGKSKS